MKVLSKVRHTYILHTVLIPCAKKRSVMPMMSVPRQERKILASVY